MTGESSWLAALPADILGRICAEAGIAAGPAREPDIRGGVNAVSIVGPAERRMVVRARPSSSAAEEYRLEAWCALEASRAGVRTPSILAVGSTGGWSWSVQEHAAGVPATRAPDPPALWHRLGALAVTIGRAELSSAPDALFTRFGRDLDAAWQRHLDYGRDSLTPEDPLIAMGVCTAEQQAEVRRLIDAVRDTPRVFGLVHGDLTDRNALVAVDGEAVIIDWGSARTGPVPHQEIVHLLSAMPERTEEMRAFAGGAAAALQETGGSATVTGEQLLAQSRALHVIEAIDLVRWALDRAPEEIPRTAEAARRALAEWEGTGGG